MSGPLPPTTSRAASAGPRLPSTSAVAADGRPTTRRSWAAAPDGHLTMMTTRSWAEAPVGHPTTITTRRPTKARASLNERLVGLIYLDIQIVSSLHNTIPMSDRFKTPTPVLPSVSLDSLISDMQARGARVVLLKSN